MLIYNEELSEEDVKHLAIYERQIPGVFAGVVRNPDVPVNSRPMFIALTRVLAKISFMINNADPVENSELLDAIAGKILEATLEISNEAAT